MDKQKENANAYVINFIRSKGGAKRVQHDVSLHYQALLQLEQGKRFGSAESLRKLADAFPDFDIAQALGHQRLDAYAETLINQVNKYSDRLTADEHQSIEEYLKGIIAGLNTRIENQEAIIRQHMEDSRQHMEEIKRLNREVIALNKQLLELTKDFMMTGSRVTQHIQDNLKEAVTESKAFAGGA